MIFNEFRFREPRHAVLLAFGPGLTLTGALLTATGPAVGAGGRTAAPSGT